jgi:ribosomal protein S18 acetylase RimI-like enzyme
VDHYFPASLVQGKKRSGAVGRRLPHGGRLLGDEIRPQILQVPSLQEGQRQPALFSFIEELLGHVREQMSSVDSFQKSATMFLVLLPYDPSGVRRSPNPAITDRSDASAKMFEVAGICVASEVHEANRIQMCASFNEPGNDPLRWANVNAEVDTRCYGTTFCGIELIWVAEAHQRNGLATMLVEAARCHISYGCVIPREHVAFSHPTTLGKLFAASYSKRRDFLVFYVESMM